MFYGWDLVVEGEVGCVLMVEEMVMWCVRCDWWDASAAATKTYLEYELVVETEE